MKKVITLILTLIMCTLLVACAGIGDLFGVGENPSTTPTEKPRVPSIRGNYVVVFSANDSFDVVYTTGSEEGESVANSIVGVAEELGLKAPAVVDVASKTEGKCELLIGDTGRALSTTAKAAVDAKAAEDPNSSHWVWIYKDGQLALYANNSSAYGLAVAELSGKYFKTGSVLFDKNANIVGFSKGYVPVVENDLVYLFGSSEDFFVVCGDVSAAGDFINALRDLGATVPNAVHATEKAETMCEVLIGDTGRALSAEVKELVEAKKSTLSRDAWAWIYKGGQLAIYATNPIAYENAIAEFCDEYCSDGVVKVPVDANRTGAGAVHDAYMSYDAVDNFYDGYVDPFGISDGDYKQMTIERTSQAIYKISYDDEFGGKLMMTFVQRGWGIWAMGGIIYRESSGVQHSISPDNTDSEFVLRIGAETPVTLRSGNHGNYPGDDSWQPYKVDDTSMYNDRMLDVTLYDAKTGEKISVDKVGESRTVNGLRIVMHHNIYEINYTQDNVLANVERSYLYNGYDIMCDSKLYMTQDVKLGNSFSCMLPVNKAYGNCAVFYAEDGSTVYMRTPDVANTSQPEMSMGVNADYIDLWGENNSALHVKIKLNNTTDQFRDSVENSEELGYAGIRNMPGSNGLGSATNKIYCSCFSAGGEMAHGDSLNFNSCWSFSYEPDFVNPDREPDRTVGY